MQKTSLKLRAEKKSIGFVPTMGALHAGHQSLMKKARDANDVVVVSIFVNPTQFGPGEDFEKYPRTLNEDLAKCGAVGVDIVFNPEAGSMYAPDQSTFVEVLKLTDNLCGMSRPGHFRGVATVVCKLLNIVQPTRAYFGLKDYQQLQVIKRMARDLFIPADIVPVEIFREPDGLAMSSRNRYLSPEERTDALVLKEALDLFRERVKKGERNAITLIKEMMELIVEVPSTEIDYVSIVDANTLEDVAMIEGRVVAALAVKVGNTRLIDNTIVGV